MKFSKEDYINFINQSKSELMDIFFRENLTAIDNALDIIECILNRGFVINTTTTQINEEQTKEEYVLLVNSGDPFVKKYFLTKNDDNHCMTQLIMQKYIDKIKLLQLFMLKIQNKLESENPVDVKDVEKIINSSKSEEIVH